jgi:hypothetical protein
MSFMPAGRACVKSQPGQLCLFAWAESLPTTFPTVPQLHECHPLVVRLHRKTGWSLPRCHATIEANGGPSHV